MIAKIRASRRAAKFEDLFDRGDTNAHHGGDDSAADLGLLGMLAFYTQDVAQLEEIFSSSALGRREKWRRRDDYRKGTIRKALAEVGEAYDWTKEGGRSRPIGERTSASSSRPIKGNDDDDDDDNEQKTVAGLFADPPEWLKKQLVVFADDEDRHLRPLCGAVAAVVLGDAGRAAEVSAEVEEALGRC